MVGHCGRTSMLAIRFYENHCTIVLHSEQRSKPQTEFNGYVSEWSFAKELLTLLRPFQIAVGVKNDFPLKLSLSNSGRNHLSKSQNIRRVFYCPIDPVGLLLSVSRIYPMLCAIMSSALAQLFCQTSVSR
ncbi:hypothetical protein V1477_002303 [Vespula maculifrons]|uniref:Uncharacterized protein n=1 Tax=Vespula maculifrons TaxID=7453 RepID=A0ABD2CW43_VESMC